MLTLFFSHLFAADILLILSRDQGELLSEEAITTIHSKLRRTKEERIAASKVLISFTSKIQALNCFVQKSYFVVIVSESVNRF